MICCKNRNLKISDYDENKLPNMYWVTAFAPDQSVWYKRVTSLCAHQFRLQQIMEKSENRGETFRYMPETVTITRQSVKSEKSSIDHKKWFNTVDRAGAHWTYWVRLHHGMILSICVIFTTRVDNSIYFSFKLSKFFLLKHYFLSTLRTNAKGSCTHCKWNILFQQIIFNH